jgi:pimeloyl-ACP methyl ester carboxylesterase
VFVHGIFSDSRSCWLYKSPQRPAKDQYWPEIVRYDSRFDHPSIFLGGFYTALDSGPYGIPQAASELVEGLKLNGVLDKKHIIFVAHSTGGIVTRYMLYHSRELFRTD